MDTDPRIPGEEGRIIIGETVPKFPSQLRNAGIEGRAVMAVAIDENGNVTDVQPMEATDRRFAESAADAIRKWKFIPATKNGVNVGTVRTIPIMFHLR